MSGSDFVTNMEVVKKNFVSILFFFASGIVLSFLALAGFAGVLSSTGLPHSFLYLFTTLAASAGTFAFSYLTARKLRHSGIPIGLACAAVMIVVFMLASFAMSESVFGVPGLFKMAAMAVSSVIAAILGVNSKKRRR